MPCHAPLGRRQSLHCHREHAYLSAQAWGQAEQLVTRALAALCCTFRARASSCHLEHQAVAHTAQCVILSLTTPLHSRLSPARCNEDEWSWIRDPPAVVPATRFSFEWCPIRLHTQCPCVCPPPSLPATPTQFHSRPHQGSAFHAPAGASNAQPTPLSAPLQPLPSFLFLFPALFFVVVVLDHSQGVPHRCAAPASHANQPPFSSPAL
eukprot:GGOE01004950.1.p1 GENE.GGOE01004950.1~~GGOE01004950.1.p1  ORF type:complete len:208 (-),score=6.15 GGOE01004950.1:690-1313(-)